MTADLTFVTAWLFAQTAAGDRFTPIAGLISALTFGPQSSAPTHCVPSHTHTAKQPQ